MLWGIKASGPLLRMEGSYFVGTILTGKIKDSRAATVKESYINITEMKDNTCRSQPLNLRSGLWPRPHEDDCKRKR